MYIEISYRIKVDDAQVDDMQKLKEAVDSHVSCEIDGWFNASDGEIEDVKSEVKYKSNDGRLL